MENVEVIYRMMMAQESCESIRLTSVEERELLDAMEQIRRGEYMESHDLLNELWSRLDDRADD